MNLPFSSIFGCTRFTRGHGVSRCSFGQDLLENQHVIFDIRFYSCYLSHNDSKQVSGLQHFPSIACIRGVAPFRVSRHGRLSIGDSTYRMTSRFPKLCESFNFNAIRSPAFTPTYRTNCNPHN